MTMLTNDDETWTHCHAHGGRPNRPKPTQTIHDDPIKFVQRTDPNRSIQFSKKIPQKNWNRKTKSTRCGWGGGCGSTVSSAASLCSFSDLVSFPFDRGEKATSGGRGYTGRDAPHWSAPNPSGGRGFRAPLNKTKFISQLARLIKRYRHANCFQRKFLIKLMQLKLIFLQTNQMSQTPQIFIQIL